MAKSNPVSTGTVTSADGTIIAYERVGTGPSLILIDAAGHYRAFSSFDGLLDLLAPHFTVYHYDRRGRGASIDTSPFSPPREVDDLAALLDAAGGPAFLYGFSSGGLVALHAAASELPIPRMALLEPPLASADDRQEQAAFTAELTRLTASGDRAAVVDYYLSGIGVPDEMVTGMRDTPAWAAMEAVAPTLVYDSMISEATSFDTLAAVTVPTLVLDSEGSSGDLTGMAATVARALPNGTHRSLAGEWHGVPDDVLAPVLIDFLTGNPAG